MKAEFTSHRKLLVLVHTNWKCLLKPPLPFK